MKKAKRIIGMVLLIVGGFGLLTGLISLWAVLTTRDVDYRLASTVMVLIYVLFNAGIFTLGWRLRHPRDKARDPEQERPAPAKPVYAPPRQRRALYHFPAESRAQAHCLRLLRPGDPCP